MKLKLSAIIALAIASSATVSAADFLTPTIDVISNTPLSGIGISLNKIPSAVQIIKSDSIKKQQSLSIADYMNDNLQGVSVTETQNNPFQPDITYRGYSVTPLLGGQTGMSVYVDGVRVNEPFGDNVNWDLIPLNSIRGISLLPGSNPVFGLNTLAGALSVQTKSGRTDKGVSAEISGGSWGRRNTAAQYGGVSEDGSKDFFISGNYFKEDGWRDHSPSEVKQLFLKTGWQNETTKLDLSYTGADNDMTGNGLMPTEMIGGLGREAIYTKPDQTKNRLSFLNLAGSHWLNKDTMFSANAYYRNSLRKSLNGDINDGYELETGGVATNDADCRSNRVGDADEWCSGTLNKSKLTQKSFGLNGQFAFNQDLMGKKNQFTVGGAYDISSVRFHQTTQYGIINGERGIDPQPYYKSSLSTRMYGNTVTRSIFATDTFSINDNWHLTASARYNNTNIDTADQNSGSDIRSTWYEYTNGTRTATNYAYNSLTAKHSYSRVNPAVGLNFTPNENLTVFAGYNEGTRAPTAMELGCANPLVPCKMPNQMAGDPHLDQIVAKTFDGGLRGKNLANLPLQWNLGAYRSELHDDIQFVGTSSTSNGTGYFTNIDKTRRVGFDMGLGGSYEKLSWNASYGYVDATYQSDIDLTNQVNSSKETVNVSVNGVAAYNSDGSRKTNDVIHVKKGNQLANIPHHQFKLRLQYTPIPDWTIGSSVVAFSDRWVAGNENQKHVDQGDNAGNGKVPGYAIVNLDTTYKMANGWSVFGKATNIFDKDYYTGGMLGQSLFNSSGTFTGTESNTSMMAVGAPRAAWVGLRWDFGGESKKD